MSNDFEEVEKDQELNKLRALNQAANEAIRQARIGIQVVEESINDGKPKGDRRVVWMPPTEWPAYIEAEQREAKVVRSGGLDGARDPEPPPQVTIPMPRFMRYETDEEMVARGVGKPK